MKVNVVRASIVLISSLFAASSWSDETTNTASDPTVRTVASANTAVVKQRSASAAAHATAPVASETQAKRQPPKGVEVVKVVSERDETAPE